MLALLSFPARRSLLEITIAFFLCTDENETLTCLLPAEQSFDKFSCPRVFVGYLYVFNTESVIIFNLSERGIDVNRELIQEAEVPELDYGNCPSVGDEACSCRGTNLYSNRMRSGRKFPPVRRYAKTTVSSVCLVWKGGLDIETGGTTCDVPSRNPINKKFNTADLYS